MNTDFSEVPAFLIDRAINVLERMQDDLDREIRAMKREKEARLWRTRQKKKIQSVLNDLQRKGITDENQAKIWLTEHGHDWKHASDVLDAMKKTIEKQKRDAVEAEIFRRWIVGKEKKTALAAEFGLSRATVERICRHLMKNGKGLQKNFELVRDAKSKPPHPMKETQ